MNIVQITPGAGAMYCGLCLRDNALVGELRKMGHQVVMVPLYLPFTLDEADESAGTPIFFSGINVYLEQKSAFFRRAPAWFHDLFAARRLLKWAAGKAAKTRPEQLGELTLSMLRGEAGNQARELNDLIAWLKKQPAPDVICLSTVLLLGMVRQLKSELRAPVVCMLQGEDVFLNSLPESHRALCWQILAERSVDVDTFVGTSRYFADLMRERLRAPTEKVRFVYNGINLAGYTEGRGSRVEHDRATHPSTLDTRPSSPVLGFFARMCRDKGLDLLVEAFINLRQRERVNDLKLRIGGSCGSADEPFVNSLRERLKQNSLLQHVEFVPNPTRSAKLNLLRSFTIFSVPARYGEAFGLYVVEAMAAGVPVVLPRSGAFPELVEATAGGVLCETGNASSLADSIEELLLNPDRARVLGEKGRRAVFEKFSAEAMARSTLEVYREAASKTGRAAALTLQPK
jgi:glycosyltransferase involved in cell wall biosynthesis